MSKNIFGIDPQKRTTISGSKRNSGFQAEGVDFDQLNQLLFELRADHVIGNATQLSNNNCTCVFQSSDQTFRDSQGALVTFVTGEKIIWAGLDTITASIDISTIDDLTHETLTGVTIALGSYDLDLGENQMGDLDLSGTGTLTILSSDGLRVKTGGNLIIDNQDGDIFVNNAYSGIHGLSSFDGIKATNPSTSTVSVECDDAELVDINGNTKIFSNIKLTLDMSSGASGAINGRDIPNATISEQASTWHDLWLAGKMDGTVGGLLVATVQGTCDANTLNKLTDSSKNFNDEGNAVGDLIFQKTDHTYGYIGAINSNTIVSCVDRDGNDLDLFPAGTEDYVIVRNSPTLPTGYSYAGRFGSVYNDSGSDLDDFDQLNSRVVIPTAVIFSGTPGGSYVSLDVSAFIPPLAESMQGYGEATDTTPTQTRIFIASNSSGFGENKIGLEVVAGGTISVNGNYNVGIRESQTVYHKQTGPSLSWSVSGWEVK